MSVKSSRDLDALREIGRIVRETLDAVAAAVEPGITTRELDAIGARALQERGATSAPPRVYGFPGALCISVNDEAIHGIPGRRRLAAGDLVKLDLVAEKDGYFADAAITVEAGRQEAPALAVCAQAAFHRGLAAARPGQRARDIGKAVEAETRRRGCRVLRGLDGHGVGRAIHESPSIPNWNDRANPARLTDGLVITIEPIVSSGRGEWHLAGDGWTIRTNDHQLAAHFEHTVMVTTGSPILLTA